MVYTVLFEISPAGAFGLPEEGQTVLPAREGSYVGDTYHITGIRAGYGSLSRYRSDDEALDVTFYVHGQDLRLSDNYLRVTVDAPTHGAALETARHIVDRFLTHLGLRADRFFAARPILIESLDGDDRPVPAPFALASVTMYNLDEIRQHSELTARDVAIDDQRLVRALGYFQHANWLFEQRAAIADPLDRNSELLMSAVFLNLWKAASAIIGDPSADADYQSRYKQLGFDYAFFKDKIERLRELRNDFDVAHYSLDEAALGTVERTYAEARGISREIISRYIDVLRDS